VLHAGRLFTLGISGILSSYEAESGRLLWRKEFTSEFKSTSPLYGAAMSPMVYRGLLILHAGGQDNGALMALDAGTGKTIWSWKGDGPGYASPVLAELAGTSQIVTQSQGAIIGVSAENGTFLWNIPFTTAYVQNIITPVVFGQTLIFSGLDKGVTAFRFGQAGGKWKPEKVWENLDVSFYMSTPVLSGDRLFGLSHKRRGQFVALDARTGKLLWATTGREANNAAVLVSGDQLLLLTDGADLIVAQAGSQGFNEARRYTVARSATWAHPVLAGKQILVKDTDTLTLWSAD
jgi:outer membrane protein assembly factor BamB